MPSIPLLQRCTTLNLVSSRRRALQVGLARVVRVLSWLQGRDDVVGMPKEMVKGTLRFRAVPCPTPHLGTGTAPAICVCLEREEANKGGLAG